MDIHIYIHIIDIHIYNRVIPDLGLTRGNRVFRVRLLHGVRQEGAHVSEACLPAHQLFDHPLVRVLCKHRRSTCKHKSIHII